ncbi:hypothetical protein GGF43_002860 [Coemansia sp. RSA 2618]|nr:hypothetical protein GGF43_002860 [Coemansia sp. RSA 2618]
MNFARLPAPVVSLVFHHFAGETVESLDEWKEQLGFLAVCQHWRTTSVPHVYQTLFISCSKHSNSQHRYLTNIEIIVKMGYYRNASRLVLHMGYPLGVVPFMHKVQELLCIVRPSWRSIVALRMELQSDGGSGSGAAAALAAKLASILPSVSSLYINAEEGEDVQCKVFSEKLVSAYAPQLVKCECYVMLDTVVAQFSNKLGSLVVRLDDDMVESGISVRPESLTHLYIAGNVGNTVHRLLGASGADFTNLEQLCVLSPGGGDSSDASTHALFEQLAFPNLSVLRFNPTKQIKQLLGQAQFPEYVAKLEMLTLHIGNITMYNVEFGAAQRRQLAEFIEDEGVAAVDFWSMANWCFGAYNLCSHSALTLGHTAGMPDVSRISWPFLTKLELIAPVESRLLLQLVPRLRGAREIVVHSLQFDATGAWPLEEPANERLEILRLNYPCTETSDQWIMLFLARVLPVLPAIEELFLPTVPPQFYTFVEEYGGRFPQIAGFLAE